MGHDFEAQLRYYDGSSVPENTMAVLVGDTAVVTHPYTVRDMRGKEDQFDIDRQGFAVLKHKTQVQDWHEKEVITSTYYDEMKTMLTEK